MLRSILVAAAVSILALVSDSSAQDTTSKSAPSFLGRLAGSSDSFAELKRTRRTLVAEIDALERETRLGETEIEQLARRLDDAGSETRRYELDLQAVEQVLASRKTSPGATPPRAALRGEARSFVEFLTGLPTDEVERRKKEIEGRLADLTEKRAALTKLREVQRTRREELTKKQSQLFDLEERISTVLNVSTNQYLYRTGVSIIFAIIVFFLVLKFFRIVESDAAVKSSIFSGDAGIQFITLFSIVIAVILFGILEILGANELSALLGGLSGYILGKAAPRRGASSNATPVATTPGQSVPAATPSPAA
jgi:Skp family chaperone for outer membrane proteins